MMIVARGALAPRAKNQHGNRDSVENMPPSVLSILPDGVSSVSFRNVIRSSFFTGEFGFRNRSPC